MIASSTVDRGDTPHNLTLNTSVAQELGHGCHNLTIAASNRVTSNAVSTSLVLCLLEPVKDLQASLIEESGVCPHSTDLHISVSLEQGAPVELLFNLTGASDTLTETRHMTNGSMQTYTFSKPLEGTQGLSYHCHKAVNGCA